MQKPTGGLRPSYQRKAYAGHPVPHGAALPWRGETGRKSVSFCLTGGQGSEGWGVWERLVVEICAFGELFLAEREMEVVDVSPAVEGGAADV